MFVGWPLSGVGLFSLPGVGVGVDSSGGVVGVGVCSPEGRVGVGLVEGGVEVISDGKSRAAATAFWPLSLPEPIS